MEGVGYGDGWWVEEDEQMKVDDALVMEVNEVLEVDEVDKCILKSG